MARQKVTITLDRETADVARALVDARSLSETVDVALRRLIRAERLRRDVATYGRHPLDAAERAVGDLAVDLDLDDDDVDYDRLYGKRK